jgi:cytochrome c biogenesis factor
VLLFAVCAVFVGVGTSWPLLSSLAGKPSVPGPSFYNFVNLPVVVALLVLLGLVPALGWQAMPASLWRKPVLTAFGFAAGGTLVAWFLGGRGAAALVLFFAGLAALAANLIKLSRTARRMPWAVGAPLAHVGFACMFLGIVGSSAWGPGARSACRWDRRSRPSVPPTSSAATWTGRSPRMPGGWRSTGHPARSSCTRRTTAKGTRACSAAR